MAKLRYVGATKELLVPKGELSYLEHGKIYDTDQAGIEERRFFFSSRLFVSVEEPVKAEAPEVSAPIETPAPEAPKTTAFRKRNDPEGGTE